MSILLIDVGNSRAKCCLVNRKTALATRQQAFHHSEIGQLKTWLQRQQCLPEAVYGVNVAGAAAREAVAHAVPKPIPMHWLESQAQTLHLKNSYMDPGALGADRWFAMLGVSAHSQTQTQALVLASFGTATTVETIYKNRFLGGVITPGLQMMAKSLKSGTAQLPEVGWEYHNAGNFPTSTDDAITQGIIAAQVGTVIKQWYATYDYTETLPELVISGGAFPSIFQELQDALQSAVKRLGFDTMKLRVFEDAVLEGLRIYVQAAHFAAASSSI
ncbi:type III pantothenate kinase [Brackiella oedipodis]|uniref:type III pantothenate kinase n=1 Tax=Brackiella oedipodis TaxID=124225 RepID=UPI00056FD5E6|nr:type III pantothenate kinase [Brackiella oedipodis]